jgi:hypothetical protein
MGGTAAVVGSTVTRMTPVLRCLAVAGVLALGSTEAMAQSALASAPRTEWGAPDLRGLWRNDSLTLLERPAALEGREFYTDDELQELRAGAVQRYVDAFFPEQEQRISGENTGVWMEAGSPGRRTSLIVGTLGTIPSLTPGAEARQAATRASDRFVSFEDRPLSERCLRHRTAGPPMLPLPFVNLVHVFQTRDHIALLHEESHELRIISLDGRSHISPTVRLWRGDSRGYWDGDTLVVETKNFNEKGGFRNSGEGLHLTERFQRIDVNTVLFEFTVSDPDTWTEPWSAELPLKASRGPMFEFACHEGNYSLPLVLSGARAQEREAAAAR